MGTGGRTGTRGAGLTGMRPDGTKVQVTINAAVARTDWPTPVASDTGRSPEAYQAMRDGMGRTSIASLQVAVTMEPAQWPTPRASPNENRQTKLTPSQLAGTHGLSLAASVNHWQTPCAAHRSGGNRSTYEGAPFRPALAAEVKIAGRAAALESAWPTPTARDWKSGSASPETLERNARPLSEVMRTQQPGPLNPAWVEALMGFPLGWTDPGPPAAESPSTPGSPRARRTRSRTAPRG